MCVGSESRLNPILNNNLSFLKKKNQRASFMLPLGCGFNVGSVLKVLQWCAGLEPVPSLDALAL